MKRLELAFTLLLIPLDFLALMLAAIAAFYLRFHPFFTKVRPVIFDLTLERYLGVVVGIAVLWLFVFAFSGLYTTRRKGLALELSRVFLACSTSMAAVFGVLFFSRVLFESRFIAIAGWGLAIIFVCVERIVMRLLQRGLLAIGIGTHRVALIGDTTAAEALADAFRTRAR